MIDVFFCQPWVALNLLSFDLCQLLFPRGQIYKLSFIFMTKKTFLRGKNSHSFLSLLDCLGNHRHLHLFSPDKGLLSFLYKRHYEEDPSQVTLNRNTDFNINSVEKISSDGTPQVFHHGDINTDDSLGHVGELAFRFDYYSSSPSAISNLEDSNRFSSISNT